MGNKEGITLRTQTHKYVTNWYAQLTFICKDFPHYMLFSSNANSKYNWRKNTGRDYFRLMFTCKRFFLASEIIVTNICIVLVLRDIILKYMKFNLIMISNRTAIVSRMNWYPITMEIFIIKHRCQCTKQPLFLIYNLQHQCLVLMLRENHGNSLCINFKLHRISSIKYCLRNVMKFKV